MEQRTKIILGVVAVLVVSTIALGTQSSIFKGNFFGSGSNSGGPFLYNGTIVSAVTSAVPSIVTSNVSTNVSTNVSSNISSKVSSPGGTSNVVSKVSSKVSSNVSSKVPSVVTSAVTSAVPLPYSQAREIDPDTLDELTKEILEKAAQNAYQEDPAKFTLSKEEMIKILKLYGQ